MPKGFTHFYFGDGKGKTTAALGLALRASGYGKKIVIVQFLKDLKCGELDSLELLQGVTVYRGKSSGAVFVRDMNNEEKAETKEIHDENLKKALKLHEEGKCDMLILDEAFDAYHLGLLDAAMFEGLLKNKPGQLELVITGHNPDTKLFEWADYITEMVKRKHPYDIGIAARKGIEF